MTHTIAIVVSSTRVWSWIYVVINRMLSSTGQSMNINMMGMKLHAQEKPCSNEC